MKINFKYITEKDHLGHNTKTWPNIKCGIDGDPRCRERETAIPEECNIFCCEEQSVDFMCHAIAKSF